PHQDETLAFAARLANRVADFVRRADGLSLDFQDHIARLHSAVGGAAVRIDVGDDDALLAGALDVRGRSHRQSETRYIPIRLLRFLHGDAGLRLDGELAEHDRDGALRAVADNAEIDRRAGRSRADLARQLVGVLDRFAVDRG